MSQSDNDQFGHVAGPNGDVISRESLPPAVGLRWVMSRKMQLIAAIRGGLLTVEEASQIYRLTIEELTEWQAAFDKHGKRGLRTTFIQQYRFLRDAGSGKLS